MPSEARAALTAAARGANATIPLSKYCDTVQDAEFDSLKAASNYQGFFESVGKDCPSDAIELQEAIDELDDDQKNQLLDVLLNPQ